MTARAATAQLGLFERRSSAAALAGRTDASTSIRAARALIASGRHAKRCLEALAVLAAWVGSDPPTAMELGRGDEGRRAFLAKRLFDCTRKGLAEIAGERIDPTTGRAQQTWRIRPEGRAAIAKVTG